VKGSTSDVGTNNPTESENFTYHDNYKGKNPMSRTQWRRYQRYKKVVTKAFVDVDVDPKGKQQVVELAKRPVKERFFPHPPLVKKNSIEDEELDSDFMDLEPHFDVLCNVVSILQLNMIFYLKLRIQIRISTMNTWPPQANVLLCDKLWPYRRATSHV
jgi:hypothetical protein